MEQHKTTIPDSTPIKKFEPDAQKMVFRPIQSATSVQLIFPDNSQPSRVSPQVYRESDSMWFVDGIHDERTTLRSALQDYQEDHAIPRLLSHQLIHLHGDHIAFHNKFYEQAFSDTLLVLSAKPESTRLTRFTAGFLYSRLKIEADYLQNSLSEINVNSSETITQLIRLYEYACINQRMLNLHIQKYLHITQNPDPISN